MEISIEMNCGKCGRKLIVITSDDGVIIYCQNCHPDIDKAWMLGKKLPSYFKKTDEWL